MRTTTRRLAALGVAALFTASGLAAAPASAMSALLRGATRTDGTITIRVR